MLKKAQEFLRGVQTELRKVTWPNRRELIGSTIIVIVLVIIVAFYIGFVDFVFSRLLNMMVQ